MERGVVPSVFIVNEINVIWSTATHGVSFYPGERCGGPMFIDSVTDPRWWYHPSTESTPLGAQQPRVYVSTKERGVVVQCLLTVFIESW